MDSFAIFCKKVFSKRYEQNDIDRALVRLLKSTKDTLFAEARRFIAQGEKQKMYVPKESLAQAQKDWPCARTSWAKIFWPTNPKYDFIKSLYSVRDDKRQMMLLRTRAFALVPIETWPFLGQFGGIDDDIVRVIAGLYAMHPYTSETGNFGTSMRAFLAKNHAEEYKQSFNLLLNSPRSTITTKVIRFVRCFAKTPQIYVNYRQLLVDLKTWPDARITWAEIFFM